MSCTKKLQVHVPAIEHVKCIDQAYRADAVPQVKVQRCLIQIFVCLVESQGKRITSETVYFCLLVPLHYLPSTEVKSTSICAYKSFALSMEAG